MPTYRLHAFALLVAVATLVSCENGAGDSVAAATGVAPKPIDPAIVPPIEVGMNMGPGGQFSALPVTANLIGAHGGLWLVGPKGWDLDSAAIKRDGGGHPIGVAKGQQIVVSVRPQSRDRRFRNIDCSIGPGWKVDPIENAKIGDDEKFTVVPKNPSGPVFVQVLLLLTAKADNASLLKADCREQGVPADAVIDPEAIADARPFRVIRFMDWMAANSNVTQTWETRAKTTDFNQATGKGVAVEYLVETANRADADPWFTLPLNADDGFYRNFAIYVRDHVAPGHKIYVEVSNEVWNTAFKQGQEAAAKGSATYPDAKEKAADYYYADRVRAVMPIWTDVFKDQPGRLVRVIATQGDWPERGEFILGHKDTWRYGDMLATAPYFGTSGFEVNTKDQATRINALVAAGPKVIDDWIKISLRSKAIASKYGLRYGTYEGGPGYFSPEPTMQTQLNELNRDPRMYDLYSQFLKRWGEEIGGLYVAFTSVGEFGQYGAWGHKEFRDATPAESPKWRAITDYIGNHPSTAKPKS